MSVPTGSLRHILGMAAPFTATIGWRGVILSYGMVLGAYAGWSYPAYFGEESEQPSHNIPRAVRIGLLLTAIRATAGGCCA